MRAFDYFVLVLVGVLFTGYVLYPIVVVIFGSLSVDVRLSGAHYLSPLDFSNPANGEAILNSVLVSAISMVAGGILGFFVAFALTQFRPRTQKFLFALAVLPIA